MRTSARQGSVHVARSGPLRGVRVQHIRPKGFSLNAPTAFEQLSFLHPPEPGEALTPLGIPGFAGFFLSLLEEDGWAVSITRAFAGDAGDFLIVAARGDDHVQVTGAPATAAVDVFRLARDPDRNRRRDNA